MEFSSSGGRTVRCVDMGVKAGLVPEAAGQTGDLLLPRGRCLLSPVPAGVVSVDLEFQIPALVAPIWI